MPVTRVIEAYGARLIVSVPDVAALERVVTGLPAGWIARTPETSAEDIEWRFAVLDDPDFGYRVRDGDGTETPVSDLDIAIGLLRRQLRRYVGYHARDLVFVHAGAVAHRGRAIVVPGHSFSGKTTLVAALLRAGAEYYSDEYAVIDREGMVQPYREPLALRGPDSRRNNVAVEDVGPPPPDAPVPVGAVAVTNYVPGARWSPRRLSSGQGVVALMEHAIPARERPAETLAVLTRALRHAVVLTGDRGEADATAAALLATVDAEAEDQKEPQAPER